MAESFLSKDGVSHLWALIKSKFVLKESGKGLSTNDYTSTEKNKLSGIEAGANKYTHPTYTARSTGLYKVTVDNTGHVSGAAAVSKSDITGLGIPGSDTTYSDFTGATASAEGERGLVPAPPSGNQRSVLFGYGMWDALEIMYERNSEKGFVELKYGSDADAPYMKAIIEGANTSNAGLMSAADKAKLDAFQAASNYALKSDITGVYKFKGTVAIKDYLPSSGMSGGDIYNISSASSYGPEGTNVVWDADSNRWETLSGIFSIDAITNTEIDEICV